MHKAIFALLQNPTLFFLNLAGASEGLIIAGFAAFLPKQIENQFSVTAISAALIMGIEIDNIFKKTKIEGNSEAKIFRSHNKMCIYFLG